MDELYEDLSEEELDKLEVVKAEFSKESFKASQGTCPSCASKMEKIVYSESLLDGAMTMHIIKFRCSKCSKEYLDIEEAKKYDLLLQLRKSSEEEVLHALESLRNGVTEAAEKA